MTNKPQKGQFYYHFKHNPKKGINNYAYYIEGLALHSESVEVFVAYRPLYSPNHVINNDCNFYVRPLSMFLEKVEKPELNYFGNRFNLITDENIISQLQNFVQNI